MISWLKPFQQKTISKIAQAVNGSNMVTGQNPIQYTLGGLLERARCSMLVGKLTKAVL